MLNAFQPPLKCPIMPGKYEINNQSIDFSNFAFILVDGYIYIITVKVTSTEGKNRKLAVCIRIDAKVSKIRETRRKN